VQLAGKPYYNLPIERLPKWKKWWYRWRHERRGIAHVK